MTPFSKILSYNVKVHLILQINVNKHQEKSEHVFWNKTNNISMCILRHWFIWLYKHYVLRLNILLEYLKSFLLQKHFLSAWPFYSLKVLHSFTSNSPSFIMIHTLQQCFHNAELDKKVVQKVQFLTSIESKA